MQVPSNIFPSSDLSYQRQYYVNVSASGGLTFSKEAEVSVLGKNMSLFIQTDKPVYKPKDIGEIMEFFTIVFVTIILK